MWEYTYYRRSLQCAHWKLLARSSAAQDVADSMLRTPHPGSISVQVEPHVSISGLGTWEAAYLITLGGGLLQVCQPCAVLHHRLLVL